MSLSPDQFGGLFRVAPGNVLKRDDYVPPAPGASPIPPNTMRIMHYSHPDNVNSIRKNGLLRSAGRGHTYGEPDAVWAAAGRPKRVDDMADTGKVFVEGWVRPDQLDIGRPVTLGRDGEVDDRVRESMKFAEDRNSHVTLMGNLPPNQIAAIHEPWHHSYRYLSEAGNREMVLAGDTDWTLEDKDFKDTYGRAVKKIKSEGPYSNIADRPNS